MGVPRVGPGPAAAVGGMTVAGLHAVLALADWTPWLPWPIAVTAAPPVPGVYLAREGRDGPLVYAGKAGEREKSQPGLAGRIGVYASGKAAVSGLGETVLDRALADPAWLRGRADAAERGEPARAKHWARDAFGRLDLHLCWAVTPSGDDAVALERQVFAAVGPAGGLWNRRLR